MDNHCISYYAPHHWNRLLNELKLGTLIPLGDSSINKFCLFTLLIIFLNILISASVFVCDDCFA